MSEKHINLGEYIRLTMLTNYKQSKQLIAGVTINAENEQFASSSLYSDVAFKRRKWELNMWLLFISFHITICGKMKSINS